jgi:hypothetical protein
VGVPARVIVPPNARFDAALDHANLPDPVIDMIRALSHQNHRLRDRLDRLEKTLGVAPGEADEDLHLPFDGEELPPADGG